MVAKYSSFDKQRADVTNETGGQGVETMVSRIPQYLLLQW